MSANTPTSACVLKLGSSVLRSLEDLPDVAAEVRRWARSGGGTVVVVSAFRGRTDQLVDLAHAAGDAPSFRAALLGIGELEAAAATALALDRVGVPVRLIENHEIGITAQGDWTESHPVSVEPTAISNALEAGLVPVVPGYVARGPSGSPCVLGRGGSDLTAISLAGALRARCVLIKGAGAVYEWDPAEKGPSPRRFTQLSFADALALGDRVIQPRAIRYARDRGVSFEVTGLGGAASTTVHAGTTMTEPATRSRITETHRVAVRGTQGARP